MGRIFSFDQRADAFGLMTKMVVGARAPNGADVAG
jgi:hypothetical protein